MKSLFALSLLLLAVPALAELSPEIQIGNRCEVLKWNLEAAGLLCKSELTAIQAAEDYIKENPSCKGPKDPLDPDSPGNGPCGQALYAAIQGRDRCEKAYMGVCVTTLAIPQGEINCAIAGIKDCPKPIQMPVN